MISTDITGSANGDASQVFNLLTVVANPELYGEKLKAIVEATEENKKYLALIAPASEIVQIREDIEADKLLAKQLVENANAEAVSIVSSAKSESKSILDSANAFAKKTRDEIASQQDETSLKYKEADALNKDLKLKIAALEASTKAMEAKKIELDTALKLTLDEKEKFIAMQKAISEKVKVFSEDLLK